MNEREKSTVSKMITMYCRSKHHQKDKLCPDCLDLENYAHQRLENCTFGEKKPICKNCSIHCYNQEYRNKIRTVMRFAGPRMILFYPLDTIRHLLSR